jgi:ABC-type transport system involved in multi-copper enzyme maturation permease subunit
MYFWKYWCDTRRGVYIYLGLLIFFAVVWVASMYGYNRVGHIHGDPANLWMMELGVAFALSYLCALVMGFATGSNSVGSDIGKGTGDFLLTRPRSRRYFVWAGWVAGIVELLGLIIFTTVFVFALNVWAIGPVWRQVSSAGHFAIGDKGQSAILDLPLMFAMVVLTAAVIYGLTYFMGVLLRGGQRGVIWSVALMFGYSIIGSLLKQFAGVNLPSLSLADMAPHPVQHWYLEPRIQITGWSVLALAFPFAAQVVLERSDI